MVWTKFVEKYGFLTRSYSMNNLEPMFSLKSSKLNQGIGSLVNKLLYGESFEMWVRLHNPFHEVINFIKGFALLFAIILALSIFPNSFVGHLSAIIKCPFLA